MDRSLLFHLIPYFFFGTVALTGIIEEERYPARLRVLVAVSLMAFSVASSLNPRLSFVVCVLLVLFLVFHGKNWKRVGYNALLSLPFLLGGRDVFCVSLFGFVSFAVFSMPTRWFFLSLPFLFFKNDFVFTVAFSCIYMIVFIAYTVRLKEKREIAWFVMQFLLIFFAGSILVETVPRRDFSSTVLSSAAFASAVLFSVFSNTIKKKVTRELEEKLQETKEELTAANQELSALNEELTAMNEELEASYESLLNLSNQLRETISILQSIDVKEDPFWTVGRIFSDLQLVIDAVKGMSVKINGTTKQWGEVWESVVVKSDEDVEVEIYVSRDLEKDEEFYVESVLNLVTFVLKAHRDYKELERQQTSLGDMIESLNAILSKETREEIIENILISVKKMFPDSVLSSLSIKEGEKVKTYYFTDSLKEIYLEKGLVLEAFEAKRDVIVQNVEEEESFYDVTGGEARAAVALFFEVPGIPPVVVEVERKEMFTNMDVSLLKMFVRIVCLIFARLILYNELKETFFQIVETLSYTVELRDPYTHGHSRRVMELSVKIAERMGLPKERVEKVKIAALLHDVGKIGVREAILNKASKLTGAEYEEVQKHTELGESILMKIKSFQDVAKIVRHHHEWYGGGGYPDGLKGDEIPLESRIIAVADAFDAMTSDRPYRRALSKEEAIAILEKNENFQWDPEILKIALELLKNGV